MRSRILPAEEWSRLNGTELETVWPRMQPDHVQVMVVEDGDQIVGCWAIMQVVHVDGVWVHPDYRGSGAVARRLLRGVREEVMETFGTASVMTAAATDDVRQIITHLRGVRVPGDHYLISLDHHRRTKDDARAVEVGGRFHAQLEAMVGHPAHEDDEEHNRQVGLALLRGIEQHEPERAIADYNAWAQRSGYAALTYLGQKDGSILVDIVTAIISVSSTGDIAIVEAREEMPCQP